MTYLMECTGCKEVYEVEWAASDLDEHKHVSAHELDTSYDYYNSRCEWCGEGLAARRYTAPETIIIGAKWSMANAPWDSNGGSKWNEVPGYNGPGQPVQESFVKAEAARREQTAAAMTWGSSVQDLEKTLSKEHKTDVKLDKPKKEEVKVY